MYVLKKQEMFYNRILILRKTKKHLETNKNLKLFPWFSLSNVVRANKLYFTYNVWRTKERVEV